MANKPNNSKPTKSNNHPTTKKDQSSYRPSRPNKDTKKPK